MRRDQAVPLGPVGEGRLRVRVDGPPALWTLERAVVFFAAGPAALETRVTLATAVDEEGGDAADALRAVDGRRHSLRPHRDSVTLEFAAPPRRRGLARTVVLEATGYYNLLVPAGGEPQRDAFRRLVERPGAIAELAARERAGGPPPPLIARP